MNRTLSATQTKALVTACSAAVVIEKTSKLRREQQRALSIVSVCQFCLESSTPPQRDGTGGWGTSKLTQPPNNNPFGIKAMQRLEEYGSFSELTWEVLNGKKVEQVAAFQKFPSLDIAFSEHQALLLRKPQVMAALPNGWESICESLGPPIDATHCGYSTNPVYKNILIFIGQGTRLDEPGFFEWYAAGAKTREGAT